MTDVERLLSGRDERYIWQKRFLSESDDIFLCQISLNIPGLPKRAAFCEEAVKKCRGYLLRHTALFPKKEKTLVNDAGVCWIGAFRGAGKAVFFKKKSMEIEEKKSYGRIFDIDVITRGGNVSRNALNIAPRRCLLCRLDAKFCAREKRHPQEILRETALSMIKEAALDL